MPTHPTVETLGTGGPSRLGWVDAVFNEYVMQLDRRGVPFERALLMARWLTCLAWLESGEGLYEYNFNAGNLRCEGTEDAPDALGWHGECHRLRTGLYRAYATRPDAIADTLDLLQGRLYARSWLRLLDDPEDGAGWYAQLQHDGYSAPDAAGVRLLMTLAERFREPPR